MIDVDGGQRAPNAFERWMAAALPVAPLWRFALGVVVGLTCWYAIGYSAPWVYYYGWLLLGLDTGDAFLREMSAFDVMRTHLSVVVMLVASTGFWVGTWIATKLHRQAFWSLVSPMRRINWRWFGVGILLAFAELGLGSIVSLFFPGAPAQFNQPDMAVWAAFVVPVVLLTFVQSGGEELFFRGYLMQRLAARFRSPLIWGVLPSLLFGGAHFFNGATLEHALYYVASTALFGVTAAVTVWRTGDLSIAIAYHFATNIAAFLYAGSDDMFAGTPLWLVPVEDEIASMPSVIAVQLLILAFVLSPWGPKARRGEDNETTEVSLVGS